MVECRKVVSRKVFGVVGFDLMTFRLEGIET